MNLVLETPVLVVGAGPIGLTAANLLAGYGVDVLVVEKLSSLGDEPRAISITDESLRVMDQIGILESLRPEMAMDTGARYFGRHGQLLAEVHPGVSPLGYPGKSQFDQPDLERLLYAAAVSNSRIQIDFDTQIVGLVDCGTHTEVSIDGPGGHRRVDARWVLACDGGRSTVRSLECISMTGSTQIQKWIVVDVVEFGQRDLFAEFHCNGKRPTVIVPGAGGRCRYEFMLLPGESDEFATSAENILRLLAPYRNGRVEHPRIRRAAVYTAHQRIASTYRRGRVLLAGDAAHMMPPFAGQGLNAGVRDAANVAWKIAACIRGTGTDALLDTYDSERRPHASRMITLSRRIGQIVMSTDKRVTAVRDLIVFATGIVPPLKRWITEMRFLVQPHFTEGCVTPTSHSAAVSALVGSAFPQPIVRTSSGTLLRLDKCLGNGWSAIRFTAGGRMDAEIMSWHPDTPASTSRCTVHIENAAVGSVLHQLSVDELTVLIRPDRYVAAICARIDESATLDALGAYVPGLSKMFSCESCVSELHESR